MRRVEKVGHRELVEQKPSPDLVDICFLVPVLEPHPDSHAFSEGSTVGRESSGILLVHYRACLLLCVQCGLCGRSRSCVCILSTDTVLGMQWVDEVWIHDLLKEGPFILLMAGGGWLPTWCQVGPSPWFSLAAGIGTMTKTGFGEVISGRRANATPWAQGDVGP